MDYDWEDIYTQEFRHIYKFLLKITKDKYLAEDITSECFLKAMDNIDSYRADSDMRIWLLSIAKNTLYDYYKKHNRLEFDFDFESIKTNEDLEIEIIEKMGAKEIYLEILKLNPPYREVLKLRLIYDLSYKEIASQLKRSINWVSVTYHRGKLILRDSLEDYYEGL
ncbi:MAG: sigma-70 family RNA polymerase sigma factor [Tissierellia bacterium]|nr:sigma-70 family RNA polymerase sigma factor [Tissierellia bacterium]